MSREEILKEGLHFTVAPGGFPQPEVRANFEAGEDADHVAITLDHIGQERHPFQIHRQQLVELGMLMIALAGKADDYESIGELLDGFGLVDVDFARHFNSCTAVIDSYTNYDFR